jgi:hypothetical protein
VAEHRLLLKGGTISKRHARAGNSFRSLYERAGGLGLGQSAWDAPRTGSSGPAAGLSEMQIFALDNLRQCRAVLGRLWEIVVAICVDDMTLRDYGRRSKTNPTLACGRFMAAMDVLSNHFSPEEPGRERHTIGSQTGLDYVEGPPAAATRWAAD